MSKDKAEIKRLSDVAFTPIEQLHAGNMALTHRNRFEPVLEVITREYMGDMMEVELIGSHNSLYITPNHPVAVVAPNLPVNVTKTETARSLRQNQTVAENQLWEILRDKHIMVKFRRQHPLGSFILDFYAPKVRLAIEVDSSIHNRKDQREYDQFRQKLIEHHDIEFMRF